MVKIEPSSGTFPDPVGWIVAEIFILGFKLNRTSDNPRFLLRIELVEPTPNHVIFNVVTNGKTQLIEISLGIALVRYDLTFFDNTLDFTSSDPGGLYSNPGF